MNCNIDILISITASIISPFNRHYDVKYLQEDVFLLVDRLLTLDYVAGILIIFKNSGR